MFKEAEDNEKYEFYKSFRVLIREVFQDLRQATVYVTPSTGESCVFPTQTIIAMFFQ